MEYHVSEADCHLLDFHSPPDSYMLTLLHALDKLCYVVLSFCCVSKHLMDD